MALRLRRGTDAERLTITPAEGELIYTTDLQELWIGDGITTGGNKISGTIPQFLADLNNVDAASPEIGQVLKWDGNNWVASSDENTGVVEDASYKINILGNSNTTIVDSDTDTFTGNFVGDGSGLTNLPIAADGSGVIEGSAYRINIVDNSSTIIVDSSTSTFTGNFVGDGSGLTNLPGLNVQSLFDLNDVFAFTPPIAGDVLTFDGVNFVPEKITIIQGTDSTVIVDAFSNTFTGNFVGDGSGLTNLPGSNIQSVFDLNDVFAFTPPNAGDVLTFDGVNFVPEKITIIQGTDSTIIVDAFTNTFTGNFVGDGSGLTNLPGSIIEGSNYRINIIDNSSAIMVDTSTSTFTGNFVGDGSGLTNLPSGSIFNLNDVFAFTPPNAGDVLTFDGVNFVPEKITIIQGTDSTIIVDAFTNTFTGNFVGDGSGLTNLPGSIIEGSNYRINIIDNSSAIMVDTSTSTFTGNFVGDGSGLTNLPSGSIFNLNDVFAFTPPNAGDVLTFDGVNFVPEKITIIQGTDSTIIVDAFTNTFTGNFVGDGSGLTNLPDSITEGSNYRINIVDDSSTLMVDTSTSTFTGNFVGDGSGLTNLPGSIVEGSNYRINIIGDDSTVLVNTTSNRINADTLEVVSITAKNNILNVNPSNTNAILEVAVNSVDDVSRLSLIRVSESNITSDNNITYGTIRFNKSDVNGNLTTSIIVGRRNSLIFSNDSSGLFADPLTSFYWIDNQFGISNPAPEKKLDVNGDAIIRGNGTFTGSVNAASFNGSLVSDDSTTLVDATNGTVTARGFIQFGSFTTAERNLLVAENGMVIYNTTENKFQGYANGTWVDFH
jgi:Ni,Fe-hydrogenase maturation factor